MTHELTRALENYREKRRAHSFAQGLTRGNFTDAGKPLLTSKQIDQLRIHAMNEEYEAMQHLVFMASQYFPDGEDRG